MAKLAEDQKRQRAAKRALRSALEAEADDRRRRERMSGGSEKVRASAPEGSPPLTQLTRPGAGKSRSEFGPVRHRMPPPVSLPIDIDLNVPLFS